MSNWFYTLRERFTPASSDGWKSYLDFSGFRHITELVTLDASLCPDVITELTVEDWNHNVHEDYRLFLFRNPQYLRTRQPLDPTKHQVLAVTECPDGTENTPAGFSKCGYDIMDEYFGNSTLTNCGPIPEAFNPAIVNEFGLLSEYKTAIEVRNRMRELQPDDPHLGECEIWSIARILPSSDLNRTTRIGTVP